MSEKSLMVFINKQISWIQQQSYTIFGNNVQFTNIDKLFEIFSQSFVELLQKIGDLIKRLKQFNKKKFKFLIQYSFANMLGIVIQQIHKISILDIITNINIYLNQSNKQIKLWQVLAGIRNKCKR